MENLLWIIDDDVIILKQKFSHSMENKKLRVLVKCEIDCLFFFYSKSIIHYKFLPQDDHKVQTIN